MAFAKPATKATEANDNVGAINQLFAETRKEMNVIKTNMASLESKFGFVLQKLEALEASNQVLLQLVNALGTSNMVSKIPNGSNTSSDKVNDRDSINVQKNRTTNILSLVEAVSKEVGSNGALLPIEIWLKKVLSTKPKTIEEFTIRFKSHWKALPLEERSGIIANRLINRWIETCWKTIQGMKETKTETAVENKTTFLLKWSKELPTSATKLSEAIAATRLPLTKEDKEAIMDFLGVTGLLLSGEMKAKFWNEFMVQVEEK